MKIHSFSCGTMRPYGGGLWDGATRSLGASSLTCRCLLAETSAGLVLVDTGFGMREVFDPENRLNPLFRIADRVRVLPGETAFARIGALGLDPRDVRHVVMTHLDFDHAGGLSDFPWATVHVLAREARAARARRGLIGRARYRPEQLPRRMHLYDRLGLDWFGFRAVRDLEGLPPDIVLVPLPGHTEGHCGVALYAGDQWLLHAGDAVFNLRELMTPQRCPPLAQAYEVVMQSSARSRVASQNALRALLRLHADVVQVTCTHDPMADPLGVNVVN